MIRFKIRDFRAVNLPLLDFMHHEIRLSLVGSEMCIRDSIAKDAGMEIMRYASGERQIERAHFMRVSDLSLIHI